MIVALSGSHSTGKSTLLEMFKNLEGVTCIPSVTRKTISAEERKVDGVQDLNTAQLSMLDSICDVMEDIVSMNLLEPNHIFILDRCVFDFLAYTRCFAKRGKVSEETLKTIEASTKQLSSYLDLVVYLGIEFDIVDDGVRSLDEILRKEVDQEIRKELEQSSVEHIKLTGSVDERFRDLQEKLSRLRG